MEFNLEDYRLSDSTLQEMLAKPRTAKVRRTRGLFIRGPIPIEWVRQAALLPGKAAVAVGMAVWHGMGMEARGGALKLTPRLLNRLGVNRKSANRGEWLSKSRISSLVIYLRSKAWSSRQPICLPSGRTHRKTD